jgi:hypothetical protein
LQVEAKKKEEKQHQETAEMRCVSLNEQARAFSRMVKEFQEVRHFFFFSSSGVLLCCLALIVEFFLFFFCFGLQACRMNEVLRGQLAAREA